MSKKNSASFHLAGSNQLSLAALFAEKSSLIEKWFHEQWEKNPPPITSSVDLRNADFKLAPVDTNLFPAGFNNLDADAFSVAVEAVKTTLRDHLFTNPSLLLIVESHTRNFFYFRSVHHLVTILEKAGFDVRIGSLDPTLETPRHVSLAEPEQLDQTLLKTNRTDTLESLTSKISTYETKQLLLEPIKRIDDRLYISGFEPAFILLNNDLSSGIPPILQGLSQPIYPDIRLGWASRLKSTHFNCFNQVASNFAELLGIDSWHINPYFEAVENLDFMTQHGIENLAEKSQQILDSIQKKYKEYNIRNVPFVMIKADNGTYGMSVMSIRSGEEVFHLNRKKRSHMTAIKGGKKVDRVIIQEGVYTLDKMADGAVAEPVIYMIGQYVIGGFYRLHHNRQADENLNSPGMKFQPLSLYEIYSEKQPVFEQNTKVVSSSLPEASRLYSYGVVARLAALAAAKETLALR